LSDVPRVKLCGVTRNEDARAADELGADLVGIVLSEGFGRSVHAERAGSVVEGIRTATVAVVVDETPSVAAELAARIGASVIQLHGDEDVATVEELRRLGEWTLWKAVRAGVVDDVARAVDRFGPSVDGILVEGRKEGVVGGGGVGVRLEPEAVRGHIPPELDFILAGGLVPESVADAVARFGPDVVDVSSGIERSIGIKDSEFMRTFIKSARMAFGLLHPEP
jgi:phosphoribosylanthranilate isomerase